MADRCSEESGAEVLGPTSHDPARSCQNIIDGDDATFWPTTGLYPQEFVIKLGAPTSIRKITTATTNVRKMVVERCELDTPTTWEKVCALELPDIEARLHTESYDVVPEVTATHIKVKILEGWDDFSAVHRFCAFGDVR